MPGTRFSLEIQPLIPPALQRLEELANDLRYSWDSQIRSLFVRLDPELWNACGHKPKVFLRRISQEKLDAALQDHIYMRDYNVVLSTYDAYNQISTSARTGRNQPLDRDSDLIAYFCAEFGFHESFPIYSGGLGILAGDHCKAASDLDIPFVAIGLLYREGYFHQTIDGFGNQVAHYYLTEPQDLPITPAVDSEGREIHIQVPLPGRKIEVKVWQARAGHIRLYFLDTDLPGNRAEDRPITYHLYGGDINTRIQQEIVLGIGGVRALSALGLQPTVWHINEGHSAFQILERCRLRIEQGLDFDSAMEVTAAGTVFTTHTPVPAGHDIFEHEHILEYFQDFIPMLKIAPQKFLALGAYPGNPNGFNMTSLAMRGSRFHNGVSRIHGDVASHMEAYVWPQIPAAENPVDYVTNGVHVPTFLAREWINLLDLHFGGGWRSELCNQGFWQGIDGIPDHSFWSVRQSLKSKLFDDVYGRIKRQHYRNGCSPTQIERLTRHLTSPETDILTIGFARRFATYKRALLLFSDPQRLARLVNDPQRPVMFIFAGKAHPHDVPGQELLKKIHEFSRQPEFEGKIILVEGYDLALGRKLVKGVDVWLNTPQYPLEASGTSGEKAGINGAINLSVLDGWWGEGHNGENGWAITPHGPQFDDDFRNREEAHELLDLLESEVIPLYYRRDGHGYSREWVAKSKASMKSLIPCFNAQRMVMDYVRKYYSPASKQCALLREHHFQAAVELARWKERIAAAWPQVKIRRIDSAPGTIKHNEIFPVEIAACLGGLDAGDVYMECLVGSENDDGEFQVKDIHRLEVRDKSRQEEALFRVDMRSPLSGLQYYKIRMYPYHELLGRRFETGLMLWL